MNKIIIAFLFLILPNFVIGQDIRISITPVINGAFYYKSVDGGTGQNLRAGINTNLDFLFLNDNKINFGFGLRYNYSQLEFVPIFIYGLSQHKENVNILSFRSLCSYKLKKQFYLSLDPSLDFHIFYDPEKVLEKQSGIGLSFGIGRDIKLKENIYLNIEPQLSIYNIISFYESDIYKHLTTLGINIGISFED